MTRQYPAFLHKDEESSYGISFPDFPGCITAGDTPEEAYTMAVEVLLFHIEGLLEEDKEIPLPSELDNTVLYTGDEKPLAVMMIPVKIPVKAKRINITIDENLLDAIDETAQVQGMNRSAFLAEGARRLIRAVRSH